MDRLMLAVKCADWNNINFIMKMNIVEPLYAHLLESYKRGYFTIFKLLLDAKKIDPSASCNNLLVLAFKEDKINFARVLLKEEKVVEKLTLDKQEYYLKIITKKNIEGF